MVLGTDFPDGAWDPLLKAGAIAAKFAACTNWMDACDPGKPDNSEKELHAQEEALAKNAVDPVLSSVTRINEIQSQATDFTPYWANLLSCSAASRPATWTLVLVALQVGGLIAAHFKLKYKRARPAQVWPVIAPIIPTPGHPSYPQGHALQAYLIAACVTAAVPAMGPACDVLARRIALNRELAGVHFPSDKEASKKAAEAAIKLLLPVVADLIEAVGAEWGNPKSAAPPPIPPLPTAGANTPPAEGGSPNPVPA
jgi:acid phosphatase (class A)